MNWFLAAIVCLLASALPARAAVILNEISPRTDPEWVELYNDAPTPVDLASWKLVDKAGNTEYFATQSAIPATSYLVFTRAKGWLNDTSDESLFLYDAASSLLDSVSYPSVKEGLTVARIPSVSGAWFTDQSPSLGFANPTPTPSPPASPSPSPTISPSPVASPVIAATPTPSPSPVPSPSVVVAGVVATPPSSGRSISPGPSVLLAAALPGTVAGVSEPEISLAGYGRSPAPPATQSAQGRSTLTLNQSRLRLVLALGAGLVLLSLAGYLGYRAHQAHKQTIVE